VLTALVLLALAGEIVALQWAGGAFHSEWGYFCDEAAHYVSGLMVRDYVTSGEWSSPIEYAKQYYAHYPKIGLGNWPPLFYAAQAAWGLLFSHEKLSTVLFAGVQTWLLATVLYLALRRYYGWVPALCMAGVFVAIPLVQQLSGVVMADVMVALFCFGAMLCFVTYLESGRWRWSVGFGVVASLAVLTKGTGVLLGFLPVYFILLSGDYHRLRQPSFYAPLGVVLLCCGPWYYFTLGIASQSWTRDGWSTAYASDTLSLFGESLLVHLGPVLLALAAFGLVGAVARRRAEGSRRCLDLCAVSLILSLLCLHLVVPNGPVERFLIPAIPAVLVLAASGCESLVARFSLSEPRKTTIRAGVMLVVAGLFMVQAFYVPAQQNYGFGSVVETLHEKGELTDSVVLVSSDVRGEGMLIGEVARLDHQAKRCFVLRASKALAVSSWDSKQKLRVLYETPEEICRYLDNVPVDFVVLDDSIPKSEADLRQQAQLLAAVESRTDSWRLIGTFDRQDGAFDRRPASASYFPDAIRVYGRVGRVRGGGKEIRVDMRETLGGDIVVKVPPDPR